MKNVVGYRSPEEAINSNTNSVEFFKDENYFREIHFKAGEIHLKHFLFVNRILDIIENSKKIAKSLANEITSIYKNCKLEDAKSLTVIGYMEYMETLLFLTIVELKKNKTVFKKLEYKILSEHEENYSNTSILCQAKNVIIITPVGVTLHKEFEIKKKIQQRAKYHNASGLSSVHIINPIITIFLIIDEDLKQAIQNKKKASIKRFGWESINIQTKNVRLKNISNTNPEFTNVKFLYPFFSKVYESSKCKLCMPDEISEEKPLLIFDKKTHLPNTLFWKPITENFNKNKFIYSKSTIEFNENCVINGHSKWNGICFLHWIDHEEFYRLNKVKIKEWLEEIKSKVNYAIKDSTRIVIFTPGQYQMSDFLTQINNIIFKKRASIIHYNASENLNENFIDFYRPLLKDIKTTSLFFASDVIDNEFDFINFLRFLNHAQKNFSKINYKIRFEGMFTMISRLSRYSETEFQNIFELRNFYGYFKLNVPPLFYPQLGCPLCSKIEHYRSLSESSMLDFLKTYYKAKSKKIETNSIIGKKDEDRKPYEKKDYYRFVAEDEILKEINKPHANIEKQIQKQLPLFNRLRKQKFDEKFLVVLVTDQLFKILISEYPLSKSDYKIKELQENFSHKYPVISDINDLKDDIRNYIFLSSEKKISNTFSSKEIDEEIKRKMSDLISLVLFSNKIYEIRSNFTNDKFLEVFDKRIEKNTIKVLAFSPFVIYKDIKSFVFRYTLIQLQERMDEKYMDRYLFKKFLSLKFFQNRSVILGSNFLLRHTTLESLKEIFDKGNKNLVNKSILKCLKSISEIENIIKKNSLKSNGYKEVCKILIKNLRYRINRIKNYNYFIVALIKERIHENLSTSFILEESLNQYLDKYGTIYITEKNHLEFFQNSDFFYLWRLLKLENIYPLQKFVDNEVEGSNREFWNNILENLYRKKKNENIDFFKKIEEWRNEKFVTSVPDINSLNEFLSHPFENQHNQNIESLFYTILLVYCLKKQDEIKSKEAQTGELEDRLAIIMKLMAKILGFNDSDCTLSIFVDVKAYLNITFNIKDIFSIVNKDIDFSDTLKQNGIISNMLNGISETEAGYPQTFLELIESEKGYSGLKRDYFAAENNEVNENPLSPIDLNVCLDRDNIGQFYKKEKDNYIALIRFSKPSQSGRKEFSKKGNAIFAIATHQPKANFIHPNAIRLLLIARPYIENFINLYFQNDTFRSYNDEIYKNKLLFHFRHGLRENYTSVSKLTDKSANPKLRNAILNLKAVDAIMKASINQIYLSNVFLSSLEKESIKIRTISVKAFVIKYKRLLKVMLDANFEEGPIIGYEINLNSPDLTGEKFLFSDTVFDAINVELFINIKRYFTEIQGEKKCFIRFQKCGRNLDMEIGNTIKYSSISKIQANLDRIKKHGGINLIKKIYEKVFGYEFRYYIDKNSSEFIYSFRLRTNGN